MPQPSRQTTIGAAAASAQLVFDGFRSAAFLRAVAQIERLARHPAVPILLEGESGTGKTGIARLIHAWSPRSAGPFRHLVLSAVDDSLAASELFGHVSGAFTDARTPRAGQFVTARGGTLFLDEIGKASIGVQQKLLHAVEYHDIRPVGSDRDIVVDVRIVAATNISLQELTAKGMFLPDLTARLSTFRVQLPPLRERRADIQMLVRSAIDRHSMACGYAASPRVSDELLSALQRAPWPNNLRELDATIQRILIDAEGDEILRPEHCRESFPALFELARIGSVDLAPDEIERVIAEVGGVSKAARRLGVHRTTIHRHRRDHGGET